MGLLKQIDKYLTEYNFFIAFCSVAFVGYFSLLMKYPFPPEIYLFTFCSTLSVYNLFRGYRTFADFRQDLRSFRFFLVTAAFIACATCFFMLPVPMQLFYTAVGAITLLYKFNIFGISNLRSIPYLKLPIITFVWLLSGSIFLLIHIDENLDVSRIAGLLVMQFCFIIAITIPFDVFGLIEDDITTIPGKIGIRRALLISKSLLAVYLTAAVLIHQRTVFLYAAGLTALLTFAAIHFSPLLKRKSMQYYLLDGTIIVQTVVFYLFLSI